MEPSDRVFELAAELFGVLSVPTRLRIVCALRDGEQNVGALCERLGVSQPSVSQHLSTLYRHGIVARRRSGALVYYRLASVAVQALCEAACLDAAPRSTGNPGPAGVEG